MGRLSFDGLVKIDKHFDAIRRAQAEARRRR